MKGGGTIRLSGITVVSPLCSPWFSEKTCRDVNSRFCYNYLFTQTLCVLVIAIKGKLMFPYKRRFSHFAPLSNEETLSRVGICAKTLRSRKSKNRGAKANKEESSANHIINLGEHFLSNAGGTSVLVGGPAEKKLDLFSTTEEQLSEALHPSDSPPAYSEPRR